MGYFNTVLAHYVSLAKTPGWKHYVWDRVNELAKQEQFAELPRKLTEAMNEVPKHKD